MKLSNLRLRKRYVDGSKRDNFIIKTETIQIFLKLIVLFFKLLRYVIFIDIKTKLKFLLIYYSLIEYVLVL